MRQCRVLLDQFIYKPLHVRNVIVWPMRTPRWCWLNCVTLHAGYREEQMAKIATIRMTIPELIDLRDRIDQRLREHRADIVLPFRHISN
jgi:hypothetical protein